MAVIMLGEGQIGDGTAGAIMGHHGLLTCYSITYYPIAIRSERAFAMRYIISSILASLPLTALAEVPQVVTDIPPVHALVAQVMGDLGKPDLLLEKGADEHDFQLRPSQMQAIADADLVVWIGPELTPWLERALAGAQTGMVSLPLLDQDGTFAQAYGAAGAEATEQHGDHDDHADHDAPAEHEGHDDHAEHADHDHNGIDPHAWMDPANAANWLDMIAAQLAQADPGNAATYTANAATAKTQITALDAELTAILAPVKDRAFVTYHDAYGYLTAHYGLNAVGSVAMGDAAAPGAAHLAELQAKLAEVTCVFPELQHDPALLLQLLDGTTPRAGAALDPVGSGLEPGPMAYADLMRGLATTLANCLNGA